MIRFICLVMLVTFGALFYVYEEVAAVKIGYTIRKQQEAKVQVLDHNRTLKYNIASLKAPHNLEKKLLSERILLESPRQWQTLVISTGIQAKKPPIAQTVLRPWAFLGKFFIGTAQAEAEKPGRR